MKKLLHILLLILLVTTLILGGTVTAFGAEAPGTAAISVMYDGNYITFKDAEPKIVNGRTMVPFRQILEDMGTVVSYDAVTKKVSAKKDALEFSFVIGGSDITIRNGADVTVKKMDVVPFVDSKTNRTYVPARFMAETLGYGVGWDQMNKTVIINDFAKLFANADEDFSILNYMVESDLDLEKTYEATGNFDVNYKITMGTDPLEFNILGVIESIQKKTDAEMTMNMSVDAGDSLNSLPEEERAMAEAQLAMLKDMDFEMKLNGTEGLMYMKTNVFGIIDPSIDADTWIKMDIFKIYDEMGIDMRELMKLSAEKTSIEQLLVSQAVSQPFTDIETYKSAKAAYAFFKNLMGDDAFDKQTSGTSATYTLDLDSKSVAAALAKTALTEGAAMSGDDLVELTKAMNDSDFGMDLVIKTTNDALASYDLNGGMDFEGTAFTLDLTGTTFDTDMFMSMSVDGFIDMTMSMDMTMDETTKKVDLTLPAGAKVVDYESFLQ